jgi:lipopolysaccharide/colanic/teichoic acid biosynthesis glycosyltransferase
VLTAVPPVRRSEPAAAPPREQPRPGLHLINEQLFRGVLVRERRRADRSNQPLVLVLVSVRESLEPASPTLWRSIVDSLDSVRRETDVMGWFDDRESIGLILPEASASAEFPAQLHERLSRELSRRLGVRTADLLTIRVHVHPDPIAQKAGFDPVDPIIERERPRPAHQSRYDVAKRAIDLSASLTLLAILSPLFAVLAALVKITSRGPVFFKQERIGQKMKPFMMLKFRTMRPNAGHAIHHEFVSSFIAGGAKATKPENAVFKIVKDPRVTPIGRFLRRTSLDELPQLWNVVRGEMSLVGPRPPVQYEVDQYRSWHLRRVLEAKPGLTGLWQVTGRSRTTFDEMVRLDLRYAQTYSLSTDLKILLATPRAVISGKGAC